jgi:hypothetical protein
MKLPPINLPRRRQLARGTALLAGVAAVVTIWQPAVAKAAKSDFHYQEGPHDGKRCADCKHFLPRGGDKPGACDIVEGTVSADGWCEAFLQKAKNADSHT